MILIPKDALDRIPSISLWKTVPFLLDESNLMHRYKAANIDYNTRYKGSPIAHTNSTMYCEVSQNYSSNFYLLRCGKHSPWYFKRLTNLGK